MQKQSIPQPVQSLRQSQQSFRNSQVDMSEDRIDNKHFAGPVASSDVKFSEKQKKLFQTPNGQKMFNKLTQNT